MKKKHLLDFNVIPSACDKKLRGIKSVNSNVPGDISDRDGRYAFSCSWEWNCAVPEPENWDGSPVDVSLSVTADDSATLSFGGVPISATYDKVNQCPGTKESSVSLMPGIYNASLSFANKDYKPPSGNVAVLDHSIIPSSPVSVEPTDNDEEPEDCECGCDGNEAGGVDSSATRGRMARASTGTSSSSAGTGTSLETNDTFARWRTNFGKFRGLGGIPSGKLEILAYEFSSNLATSAGLEFRHPLASWLDVPAGGISAGKQFKRCVGGSYTSWMCDSSGETFFKIGSSKKKSSEVRWTVDKTGVEIIFTDKSTVTYSAASGEIISYKTRNGNVFTATEISDYVDVVRDDNGILQEVWNLWDGLARIENSTTNGYTLALYLPSQVGAKDTQTGLRVVTGTPFKTFTVVLSSENKISITELDSRAGAIAFPVKFWFENNAWNETAGSGGDEVFTVRSRTENADGSWQLVTTKKLGENGVPASVVAEVFETTIQGNILRSRTDGFGTDLAQTTTYEYDDAGRRTSETRPDGSESGISYDVNGRIFARYEPQAGARCRTTYYNYVSGDSNNTDLSFTETVISRDTDFTSTSRTNYTYVENSDFRRVEKRTTGLGSESTQLEVEETWLGTVANINARGRVKMTQDKLGVQTYYDYAGTALHGALYSVVAETRIAGSPVNGKSTRTVKFISAEGNTLREEKFVFDSAGTWQLVSSADFEYDAQNRWTKKTRGNGREITREMMCCGVLWEIDEDGVRTDYTYNSAQQLTETMRAATATMPERVTVFERDARGNVLTETLKFDGPTFSVKSKIYDALGRVVSETDELGRSTMHAYSADNLAETITLPSGATLITEKHADGTILRKAGTGQRELLFEVDTVSDGVRTQTKLADNTIIAREIRNGFDEIIRTGTINTADDFFYTRDIFNARGLRVQSQTDGMAATIFEYDDFGNETRRIVKLAENPTIENSRIEERTTQFETRSDGVYSVTTNTRYNAAGTAISQSSAQLVSENATLEDKTISTDTRGNSSMSWTEFASAGTRLQKSQIPTATNISVAQIVDKFTVSQTDFAGTQTQFSRQFRTGENAGTVLTVTNGRGNTTIAEQNVLGWTTKTTDAAGNVTTTEYNLAHGKPAFVTNALGKTTLINYDLRGNKISEFGTAVYPAIFAYDDADNLVSQKLFRAGTETISSDPAERTDFNETTWSYDAETNLLLFKRFPDESEINYTYDAKNRLKDTIYSREISSGTCLKNIRSYAEATGELVSIVYNDNTTTETWAYNFLGQLTQSTGAETSSTYAYNNYGERITETISGFYSKVIEQHFDAFGRNAGYSIDGDRKQTIAYDSATGRISSMLAGTQNFSWEYLAGAALKSRLSYPNGATAEWTYAENRDLLAQVKNTVNGNVISQYDYTNDALGRRIATAKSGTLMAETENLAYSYNDRDEVTSATSNTNALYNFGYNFDNIGNRNSATESGAGTTYATNSLNQYTSIAGTASQAPFIPTFDADGNQTLVKTSTGTWSVSYNGANRPTTWINTETGAKIYMVYDSQGRRIEKRVLNSAGVRTLRERYVYNGYLCIQILNGDSNNAVVKEFVWDPTEPIATRPLVYMGNSRTLLYMYDGNKNVSDMVYLALHNGIGAHYEYAPFGAITRATRDTPDTGKDIINQNPFRFSSEFYDPELGLVYYNYRHYNPTDGRWLSRDPIEEQGGLNLYAFSLNASIAFYDKIGLEVSDSDCSNKFLEHFPKKSLISDWFKDLIEYSFPYKEIEETELEHTINLLRPRIDTIGKSFSIFPVESNFVVEDNKIVFTLSGYYSTPLGNSPFYSKTSFSLSTDLDDVNFYPNNSFGSSNSSSCWGIDVGVRYNINSDTTITFGVRSEYSTSGSNNFSAMFSVTCSDIGSALKWFFN